MVTDILEREIYGLDLDAAKTVVHAVRLATNRMYATVCGMHLIPQAHRRQVQEMFQENVRDCETLLRNLENQ